MTQQKHSRRNPIIILLVLLIIAVLGAAIHLLSNKSSSNSVSQKTVAAKKESIQQDFDDSSFEKRGKWYGLCKKNSIHSIADFKTTVFHDPVLKAHFTSFNWENAKMGKLEKATWAYVHYRKDNTIFRKETPILLAAGDGYITDGITQIRTQCCNSYAAAPNPDKAENQELDANPSAGLPPLSEQPLSEPSLSEPFHDFTPGATLGHYKSSYPGYSPYTPISGNSVGPHRPSPCPPCPCGESNPASVQGQESAPVIGKETDSQSTNTDYCYCPECSSPPLKPPLPPSNNVPEPFPILLLGIGIGCLLILIFALRKTGLHRG